MPTAAPQHPPPPQMPGWQLSNQDAQGLKEEVATILERENLRFPGAQPVSFSREHVEELQRQEYFMCEKTDGLRCLLFLHFEDRGDAGFEPVTFLIDRKNNYYNLQPAFRIPYYKAVENYEAFLYGTILDGELVNDQYPGEPTPRLNFYVFDCLAVDNENVTQKTLEKRLGRLQEYVLKPYHNMLSRIYGPNIKPDDLKPFALKSKKVYPAYSLHEMFNNVLPTLKHGNDGLIFTAKNTRYEFGTDRHILKWKPPHENTIDFKLRLGDFPTFDPQDGSNEGPIPDYDAMPTSFALLVQHNANNYQHFASLAITPSEWETLKSLNQRLDGRIIECYRTPSGDWKYKADFDGTPRWRDDKKDANHISTVNSVLASIERPVTQADLLGVEERIKKEVYRLQGREGAYRPPPAGAEGDREREAKKRKFSDGVNGH